MPVVAEVGAFDLGVVGSKLAADCRDVGEPTLASALIEPELKR